jgi:hypothetical protein
MFSYASASAHAVFDAANTEKFGSKSSEHRELQRVKAATKIGMVVANYQVAVTFVPTNL